MTTSGSILKFVLKSLVFCSRTLDLSSDNIFTYGVSMADKVVLAYSGGLDTSVAIRWLKEEYNLDVVALTIDVGNERGSPPYLARMFTPLR